MQWNAVKTCKNYNTLQLRIIIQQVAPAKLMSLGTRKNFDFQMLR